MNIATGQALFETLSGSDSIRTDCKITVKIMGRLGQRPATKYGNWRRYKVK
jgi:hypothetical protein